ncbi:hypothetical protein WR25_13821 [Diploscapter pachys]|uniref:Uncharacterized protein n=1 Tax=Diploscapter pachys TaxID=2018661 RepID=A0A2A2M590_9BILA|nr:hypothetical protein WR25_13821 [Diploscapter pachys]
MPMRRAQRLQHVVRPRRVADRQHMARARRGQRVAVPVAHSSARALDHRHQRRKVIQLQPGFRDHVEMPARQQPVIVAIAAIDRPLPRMPARGGGDERHIVRHVAIREQVRAGGGDDRALKLRAAPASVRAVPAGR